MKTSAILIGIGAMIMVGVISIIGLGIFAYVNNHNSAVDSEAAIQAQYDQGRNVLSATTTRIMEMAQVPEMYRDDLLQVVEATFEGRYGEDGSRATWQWIQEQNIQLEDGLYRNLQASIESGRNDFRNTQARLIDHRRSYIRQLERDIPVVGSGWWMRMAGFPRIDLNQFDIIVEDEVQGRFDRGRDEILQLRPQS